MRLTTMPASTITIRPRLPAASVRLETEINHPANVTMIPRNTISTTSSSRAVSLSLTFLVLPGLAFQEQRNRRHQADHEQQQIQDAAAGEHGAGEKCEAEEKQ